MTLTTSIELEAIANRFEADLRQNLGHSRMGRLPHSDSAAISENDSDNDGIRHELVAQIRDQINAGTYETDEKIDLVADHLSLLIG